MWTKRRVRTRGLLGAVALAIVMTAGAAWADVTTERPGSILILPKIVADGTRDTLIEITNTSNTLVNAHCYYINSAPVDPTQPPGPSNPPLWQEVDFFLFLTRQQPTQWLVGDGRRVSPLDPLGSPTAGLDPGLIPAAPPGFQGELICVQVDSGGAPTGGNALIGSATLIGPESDSSKYNALAILGDDVGSDDILELNNAEYRACPSELVFTHFAQGATDPYIGDGSQVISRLALVPCTHDLENAIPSQVSATVFSYDEFEDRLSTVIDFTCRLDADLDNLGEVNPFLPTGGPVFGTFRYSRLIPSNVCEGGSNRRRPCSDDTDCPGGTCTGVVGLLGVLESAHGTADGGSARSSQNLHTIGEAPGATITTVDTDGQP